MMSAETALQSAIKKAGGFSALAKAIGTSRQRIWQWKIVPAEIVLAVEGATGISRHQLRPDIYPRGSHVNGRRK